MTMEIWLDTCDTEVVSEAAELGLVAGVTTNPSILAEAKDVKKTLSKLLDAQSGPVAVQVTNASTMVEEGRALAKFSKRIIVKVPIVPQGIKAICTLKKEKIPLMGTAILNVAQALIAANLGVDYMAPYFSHMHDKHEALKSMQSLDSKPKILVASLKEVSDLLFCASLGVSAVTIKPAVFRKLMEECDVAESFLQKFASDWNAAHGHSCKKILDD